MEKGVQWRMSNPSEMFWFNNGNFFLGPVTGLLRKRIINPRQNCLLREVMRRLLIISFLNLKVTS